ncbi:MAG TPA: tetratricopeptide repeat protein [Sphingomicrobium sp.]|nr:tetratricopeptide repeat protein [Sphingomicrobium sp.]
MTSLTLAAGVAVLMVPVAASGAALTLGGPLSQLCYESALSRDSRNTSVESCSRSLQEESLTTPDRAATLVNRGILYMIRGSTSKAEADFDAALKVDDGTPDAWLNKGFLRLRTGNGRDALPLLEEGIKRQPRRAALAYFARGLAYEDMGNFSAAYSDLRRAQSLEPEWALPTRYLARYQRRNR